MKIWKVFIQETSALSGLVSSSWSAPKVERGERYFQTDEAAQEHWEKLTEAMKLLGLHGTLNACKHEIEVKP